MVTRLTGRPLLPFQFGLISSIQLSFGPGQPLVVGSSTPLTGADGAAGLEERDAVLTSVKLWEDQHGSQLKGHPIEVHAEDDGCTDGEQAEIAAKRFLRVNGLVGVIGPSCSAGAQAAIPVYAGAGIVAISGSATETSLSAPGSVFFRTTYTDDLQGTIIGDVRCGSTECAEG